MMDLSRMLARCEAEQWSVDDLDWSQPPRPMAPADEELIVQLFTNMAGIELLAAAMFREQARRTDDPTLRAIFETFVLDEQRHAATARRLARHYDVRKLRAYEVSRDLAAFAPAFGNAVRYLPDDVANSYITGGELILDIALLRSIDDHVRDPMSHAAMARINRDESRHIAIDYHMIDFYASDAYRDTLRARPPRPARERLAGALAFAKLLRYAQPFFREVFFVPMEVVDPSGRRMTEAFRHMQRLGEKPAARRTGFGRFLQAMSDVFNHPVLGPVVGPLAAKATGVEARYMKILNSREELAAARAKSYSELADEALDAKQVH
jgi:hypothetical protein